MRTIMEYPPFSYLYVMSRQIGWYASVKAIERVKQHIKYNKIKTLISNCLERMRHIEKYESDEVIDETTPIYVLWWTGESTMPDLVKVCYNNILKKRKRHPVVFIDKDNVENLFSDFKNEIVQLKQLYETKKINIIQYFVDLLRNLILSRRGGIWIDATVWLTDHWEDLVLGRPFFSGKRSRVYATNYLSVTQGLWTSYFIASVRDNPVPLLLYDGLYEAYNKWGGVTDYFTMDYIFTIGYNELPVIKTIIDALPEIHANLFRLDVNDRYNEEAFKRMMSEAPFYKLNHRNPTYFTTTVGDATIFSHIIEQS